MNTGPPDLSRRDRSILRAVEAGTAQLTCSVHPDLLIDGRYCCDQAAVHRLAAAGLIAPATPGPVGRLVPAALTPAAGRLLAA